MQEWFEQLDFQKLSTEFFIPWATNILFALAIFVIGRLVAKLVVRLVERMLVRSNVDEMLRRFVGVVLYAILFAVVIIASLDQLGVDTTSAVAVIGAAGLAIGLALQDSLKNFAAGVMLIVFKPFRAGDYVQVSSTEGTVERIDIFNTVMRTGDNKQVTVPNGVLYAGTITNYSIKPTRRIDLIIGVSYEDDLRQARKVLEDVIAGEERILAEPAVTIAVAELADSSVNFVVRPWVNTADYWPVRFALIENIKVALDDAGISIPYPQTDVHLHQPSNDELAN